jgi:hypothetical protein
MQALFQQALHELNGSVVILLAILVGAGFVLWKLGALSMKFSHHEQKLDKIDTMAEQVVELKIASGQYGTKLDKIDGLSEKVATLGGKVDLIYQNTLRRPLIEARSPIALTATGQEVA